MDVTQVNSYRSGQGEPPVPWPGSHPPASGSHPIPGGDTRSATYPVDDLHQTQMTQDVGGWGMTVGEDIRWIGVDQLHMTQCPYAGESVHSIAPPVTVHNGRHQPSQNTIDGNMTKSQQRPPSTSRLCPLRHANLALPSRATRRCCCHMVCIYTNTEKKSGSQPGTCC